MKSVFLCLLAVVITGCVSPTPPAPPVQWEQTWQAPAPVESKINTAVNYPRVMIIVDEKSLGTIATAEVETLAIRKCQAMGISVVDADMNRSTIARGQQLFKMAGDNRAAAALGLEFGAEVVIIGEAVAKPAASRIAESNLRTYQAVVTLRAVRTDNAQTLAAASKDAAIVALEDVGGSAKSLRAAAELTLSELIPEMGQKWTAPQTTAADPFPHQVELTAGGLDALWKLKALRDNLRARNNELDQVVQRSYAAGMAEFSSRSALPAEELAEALVLSPPAGLKIQILDIAAGNIQLRVDTP